jgi:hypothetical protein
MRQWEIEPYFSTVMERWYRRVMIRHDPKN